MSFSNTPSVQPPASSISPYECSTWCAPHGRLCNRIIRNYAVSLAAKRHNVKCYYPDIDRIAKLGIYFANGANKYQETVALTDSNWKQIVNSTETISANFGDVRDYFQTPEVLRSLYDFLRINEVRVEVIRLNPFQQRFDKNNDVFIHLRLDDVANFALPVERYMNCLASILQNAPDAHIYIATDSPSHPYVDAILEKYVNSTLVSYDDIETIQFGSTCKHVILSHGTYSAMIGYLAYYSTVYYPVGETKWASKMFEGFIPEAMGYS